MLIIGSNVVNSKELPHQFHYKAEEYPEYEAYFGEYQQQLDKVFKPEKYFSKHTDLYVNYVFKINSKGEIVKIFPSDQIYAEGYYHRGEYVHYIYTKIMRKELPRYAEYVKELILANPPKPIPKELSYDSFWIVVSAHYYPKLAKHMVYSRKDDPKVEYTSLSGIGGDGQFVPPEWTILLYRGK